MGCILVFAGARRMKTTTGRGTVKAAVHPLMPARSTCLAAGLTDNALDFDCDLSPKNCRI